MGNKFSLSDLESKKKKGLIKDFEISEKGRDEKKKSKYRNQIVEFNGEKFHSKRELKRFLELRMREQIGEIADLERQVPYELNEGGTHSLIYRADFRYRIVKTGEVVVNDSKGCVTKIYKKKRALMLKLYNIKILET